MQTLSRNDVFRYGSAFITVILATIARLALDPVVGNLSPFATLFFAVLVVAGYGGRGPALVATVLGALASACFLLPPRGSFAIQGAESQAGLVLYVTISLGIALLGGALRDARRRAEVVADEALRKREELRITLSSIGDAVLVTDAEGRVTSLNPVAEALTGWSASEAAGQNLPSVFRIVDESTRTEVENPALRALAQGVVFGLEKHTLLISKDGSERPLDDSAAPIRDAAGRVIGAVLVFRDISDRKRAEGEARTLLESITDAFYAFDRDWRFTYVNRRAEALMGRSREELVGRDVWEIYPDAIGSDFYNAYHRAMDERVVVSFEAFYPPHDRWYELHAYPSEDGISVFFRDIGERKRAEEEKARLTAQSEQQRRIYETALSNTPDFTYVFDLEGRFTYVNAALLDLWRKGLDEALGRRFSDLDYPPDLAALLHRQILQVIETKQPIRDETPFTSHLGEREYEYIFVPVLGAGGAVEAVAGSTRDITGRKRAERELAGLAQRLTSLVDNTPLAVVEWDASFAVARWSGQAEKVFGWTAAEVVGVPIEGLPLVYEEDKPKVEAVITLLNDPANKFVVSRNRNNTKAGGIVSCEWYNSVIHDEGGRLLAVLSLVLDVTERDRAENALRERERFTQHILDASPGIVYVFDLEERRTVFINERAKVTIGIAPEAIEAAGGRFMTERVHPDDLSGLADHLGRIPSLSDGEVLATEYRMRHADGRWLWFSSRDTVFQRAPDGRPRQVLGVASDITDRKEAEERLRDSEDRFRTMAESIPQLSWMARPDGHIYWYNRRWHEYTGTTPEQMEGWGWQQVHDPNILPSVLERWRGSIASGEPFDMVFPLKGADGRFRTFLTRVAPARGEDGRVAHWFGTNTDISDRLRFEDELKAAKEEAEDANRAKDDFLAVLSHELRTPLNPILLATTAMLDRPTPAEEVGPTLEMIRQNVSLQARLIDDLLDVMRIVRGKMPLHWGVSDCHDLIRRAVEITRSDALGKNHRLDLDLRAEDYCVNADAARLQQVLWNLIKNAIKFTPEGGTITIGTRNEGESVLIEVADTGIGIEPDILPHIFDAFHQGDTRITRKFGGLGLGLAICRGVVEAHGGTIAAESAGRDRGTTFRVALKAMPVPDDESDCGLAGADGEADGSATARTLNRLNILAVDDEAATLRLMARLLTGLGHRVVTAGTVADAWEAFQGAEGLDLIISDIGLPDGSGLDLMRKVKAVRSVPAIALTGYGMDEDIRRSREAGFTTHMTKPIDFTKLEAMIRQVAN